MSKRWLTLISVFIGFFSFCAIFYMFGFKFNTSASIPRGLYKMERTPIQRGSIVLLCPPQSILGRELTHLGFFSPGFCGNNTGYLMKNIVAIAGDVISSNAQGITVNTTRLFLSQPLLIETRVPRFTAALYQLKPNEYLVLGEHPASIDSRYFGVVQRTDIISVIKPIFTWN